VTGAIAPKVQVTLDELLHDRGTILPMVGRPKRFLDFWQIDPARATRFEDGKFGLQRIRGR
jgi:hypothetical protein